MSRNKVELPALDVTKSVSNFKTNQRLDKSQIKEHKNIHIGITNFNSKLYKMKKENVMRNKKKKSKPMCFGRVFF